MILGKGIVHYPRDWWAGTDLGVKGGSKGVLGVVDPHMSPGLKADLRPLHCQVTKSVLIMRRYKNFEAGYYLVKW